MINKKLPFCLIVPNYAYFINLPTDGSTSHRVPRNPPPPPALVMNTELKMTEWKTV